MLVVINRLLEVQQVLCVNGSDFLEAGCERSTIKVFSNEVRLKHRVLTPLLCTVCAGVH